MIIGECPYEDCNHSHIVACAEKTPAFSKQECEECKREYWLLHSRIEPEAYTLEQFAKKYDVDEETKHITKKISQPTTEELKVLESK